jgi:hypothetical protein
MPSLLHIRSIPGTHAWELSGDLHGYGREGHIDSGPLYGMLRKRVELERERIEAEHAADPQGFRYMTQTGPAQKRRDEDFLSFDTNATVEYVSPC